MLLFYEVQHVEFIQNPWTFRIMKKAASVLYISAFSFNCQLHEFVSVTTSKYSTFAKIFANVVEKSKQINIKIYL